MSERTANSAKASPAGGGAFSASKARDTVIPSTAVWLTAIVLPPIDGLSTDRGQVHFSRRCLRDLTESNLRLAREERKG